LYNVFGDGVLVARRLIQDKVSPKNVEDLARLFRLYPMPGDDREEVSADPKEPHGKH
jgi:hypothetical protein